MTGNLSNALSGNLSRPPHTAPRERPILFSAPMVRAILDGRKTQTRRAVKPPPKLETERWHRDQRTHAWMAEGPAPNRGMRQTMPWAPCPYGVPGDRLWVREQHEFIHLRGGVGILYKADDAEVMAPVKRSYTPRLNKGRPSIHMPRFASRVTLELTDVRVQRLQDISAEDAIAEGLVRHDGELETWWGTGSEGDAGFNACRFLSPVECYREVWNGINGAGAWDANPFVWALTFAVVLP